MTPQQAEQLEMFQKWLCRHLVALCAVYHHIDDSGRITKGPFLFAGSGFVMSFHDIWHLVTAGHVIKELEELHRNQQVSVEEFFLVDFFGLEAKHHNSISIDFIEKAPFAIDDEHKGLDFGFVVINQNERRLLKENGIAPVQERNWMLQHQVNDFYAFLMLGIPEELVETKVGISATGQATIGTAGSVLIKLERLEELPEGTKHTTYPRFVARIANMGDLKSIEGMSGGPIFGFAERNGRLRYWIVALQSRWDPKKRIIYGCPVPTFAQMIYNAIAATKSVGDLDA